MSDKKLEVEILPLKGLENIPFGCSQEIITAAIGEAEDVEDLEDEESGIKTEALNYWDLCLNFFMEDRDGKKVLTSIQTDNLKAKFLGKEIFKMNPAELKEFMRENKFDEFDDAEETWGEQRISYDELNLDFYFEDKAMTTISWSSDEI